MAGGLAFLGRHGTLFLFLGVFVGLLLPDLAAFCRPLLAPCVVLLLLATAVRVEVAAVASLLRRPLRLGGQVLWLQIAAPFLVWAALLMLDLPPALETAIFLMAAAPPILGSVPIAFLLGLDGALAMVAGLLATLLTPLTVVLLALALIGLELRFPPGEFMLRLGAVVAAAFLGAALIRRLSPAAWLRGQALRIDGFVVVIMLVFAVAIMDGVAAALIERPGTVALWITASFLANLALQASGWIVFRRAGLRTALTMGLITGNCNMGLLLAALPSDADPDVALYFAVAQLPMYMLPALVSPLYRRLLAAGGGPSGGAKER